MVSPDPFAALEQLVADERFGASITVISDEHRGMKAIVDADGAVIAGQLPDTIRESAIADARDLMRREQSKAVAYDEGEVFIEVVAPPPVLIVFGAVHIAQELSKHAQLLGFRVVVSDARPAFTTEERFAGATVIQGWPEKVTSELEADWRTYVVLLSHDSRFEMPVLEWALRSDARYIGAMGSRRTHIQRMDRLRQAGFVDSDLKRIHGPVGLDIGAEGPGETAISILAEMIHVRYGSGTGLSLRGRHGRIHRQRTEDAGDV